MKCLKCGHIWKALPKNLIHRRSNCPKCSRQISKGEELIAEYLYTLEVTYIREYKISCNTSFRNYILIDFYLPEYNAFIEYNGR